MKSTDTNPSLAARAATPEPEPGVHGDDTAAGPEDGAGAPADNGQRGQLPIAVSDGDFSTPTQRTRKITRPRGVRTLESPITTPAIELAPDAMGAALPAEEILRHEASVVDEFLAAPPTPVPEIQETPNPQVLPSPTDLWGLASPVSKLENPYAAEELRLASGVGVDVAFDEATDVRSIQVPVEDRESAVVDDLLEQATAQILAGAPADESPHIVTSSAAIDSFVAAPADLAEYDAPATAPPLAAAKSPEFGPVVEVPEPDTTRLTGDGAGGGESNLSPLAQTLANMAESMHGDLTLDAAIDLDIADGPLLPLAAEALPDPAPRTPAPRPTPPPIPTGAGGSADAAAAAARMPVAAAPAAALVSASEVTAPIVAAAAPLARLPEALAERPRRPKRSKPWFEEVFDESYLRTLPFMTAEQTLQEVDFIESSLGLPRGSEVLDIGCGYGRHAIELVQRGLSVTGVDLSLPLLIRAADESQRRSVAVNFVHTDMREMSFERQFSGAYCMLTSFGYFDDESNLKVAEGIARALKPGGRFLIDVVNRDYVVGDLPARVWWEGDGCVVLEEVDFNFNTNRVLTHRSVVFEDGQQLEQEISVRVYSLHELGKLLRQAGFRVIEVSGSIPTRGHFFGAHSRNLLILAERRSE